MWVLLEKDKDEMLLMDFVGSKEIVERAIFALNLKLKTDRTRNKNKSTESDICFCCISTTSFEEDNRLARAHTVSLSYLAMSNVRCTETSLQISL